MTAKSWPEIESKVAELERENAELKQALERACGLIANKEDANGCPVDCKACEPWNCGDETCMKMLIRHFKEATK